MNIKLRKGKSSELIVAGELLRHNLDVYMPCVDDKAIDLVIRVENKDKVTFYDVQVKSVRGYNRIVGVKDMSTMCNRYILIIHYRHDNKPDEFFYLTKDQIKEHHKGDSDWGDLVFNKPEREKYCKQNLSYLATMLLNGELI